MTEEQKRYQYSCELGEYLDTDKNTDPNETVYMSVADVLNDLNNHSSRVKELEEREIQILSLLGWAVNEIEQSLDCDSEAYKKWLPVCKILNAR